MDFRFKYRRGKPAPEESQREQREDQAVAVNAKQLAAGISIPATLVSGPLLGWLAGRGLDGYFHTGFWMALLIVLGALGSLAAVVFQLKALEPK